MTIYTRPTVKPQWASVDVISPVTGQNNVVTPPTEKQMNGWDVSEFPPRQWFNWLGRYTYEWILWLDQQQQTGQSGVDSGSGALIFPGFAAMTWPGGIAQLSVVDTGDAANVYQGMVWVPPYPVGSALTLIQIGPSTPTLVMSTISVSGVVSVASGGSGGPYLMTGTLTAVS